MPYIIDLPDGNEVEVPDDVPLEEARRRIRKQFPQFNPKPDSSKSGFIPALKAGVSGLKGAAATLGGSSGLMDLDAAKAFRAKMEEQAAKDFSPSQDGWSESPWTKFKEALGGSLPYMAAPVAAAGAAATLPLTGTAAAIAGLGAAGLTSAAQFTATNADRQVEEGTAMEDVKLGRAAAAAVPMAVLDMVGLKAIPLVRGLFKSVGKELTSEAAKAVAKKGFANVAADYAKATGKAMTAEGTTEAAQQFFERLQAGLSIDDDKARAEYVESFLAGAALGGAIAPAGRYFERSAGRTENAKAETAKQGEEFKAKQAALADERAAPGYLAGKLQEYKALQGQIAALDAQVVKAPDAIGVEANTNIARQKRTLQAELKSLAKELYAAGGTDVEAKLQAAARKAAVSPEEQARGQETELAALRDIEQQQAFVPNSGPAPKGASLTLPGMEEVYQDASAYQDAPPADIASPETAAAETDRLLKKLTREAEQTKRQARDAGQAELPNMKTDFFGKTATAERDAAAAEQRQSRMLAREAAEKARKDAEIDAIRRMGQGNRTAQEIAALQKLGTKPLDTGGQVEALLDTLKPAATPADPLAPAPAEPQKAVPAQVYGEVGAAPDETAPQLQELRAKLAYAQATGNRNAVSTLMQNPLFAQLQPEARNKDAAGNELLETAGVVGKTTPATRPRAKITEAVMGDFDGLTTMLDRVNRAHQANPEKLASLKSAVVRRAQNAREAIVGGAMIDIAGRRAELGQTPLTEEARQTLFKRLDDNVVELISRSGPLLHKPAAPAQPAQMRGTKIVREAVPATPQPAGRGVFTDLKASAGALRRDLLDTVNEHIGGAPATPALGPRPTATAPTPRRVKGQGWPELVGPKQATPEERAALAQAKKAEEQAAAAKAAADTATANVAALRTRLAKLEAVLAEEQKPVKGLQNIKAAVTRPTRVAELQKQREALIGKLPEAEREMAAAQAALRDVDRESMQVADTIDTVMAKVDAAQAAFDKAREEGGKTLPSRLETNRRWVAEVQRWRGAVQGLQASADEAKASATAFRKQQDEIERLENAYTEERQAAEAMEGEGGTDRKSDFGVYDKRGEAVSAQVLGDLNVAKNFDALATSLEQYVTWAEGEYNAPKMLQLRAEIAAALDTVRATHQQLIDARKAKVDMERAPASAAQRAEADAKEAARTKRDTERTTIEQAPHSTTRVFRDTKDPATQRKVTGQRKVVAMNEGKIAAAQRAMGVAKANLTATQQLLAAARKENDSAAVTQHEARAAELSAAVEEYKKQLDGYEKAVDAAYGKMYDALSNAPLVKVTPENAAQAAAADKAADAERQELQREANAFYDKAGLPRPAPFPSFRGPTVEELSAAPRTMRTGSVESREGVPQRKGAPKKGSEGETTVSTRVMPHKEAPKSAVIRAKEQGDRAVDKKLENLRTRLAKISNTLKTGKRTLPDGTQVPLADAARKGMETRRDKLQAAYLELRPARALELAGKVRGELAQAESSLMFLNAQPSKTDTGKAKQAAAKEQLAARIERLKAEVAELSKEATKYAEDKEGGRAAYRALSKKTQNASASRSKLEGERDKAEAKLARLEATAAPADAAAAKRREAQIAKVNADIENLNAQIAETDTIGSGPLTELELLDAVTEQQRDAAERKLFSVGTTNVANPSSAGSLRAELKDTLGNSDRVEIFDSVDALVKAHPEYEGTVPAGARGFVDGSRAVLIAESISKGDGLAVLLHEVGAHMGLRNMLGDAQYDALAAAVRNWSQRTDGSIEAQVAKRAMERVTLAGTKADHRKDETIAYAVEEAIRAGIKPMQAKSPLGQWLARIMAAVRKAMGKWGVKEVSAQDLVNFAHGAAGVELQKKPGDLDPPPPKGGKDLRFSKAVWSDDFKDVGATAEKVISHKATMWEKMKQNALGLNFRTKVLDGLAPIEKVVRENMDTLKGLQIMSFLRLYNQRMHFTSLALTRGVAQLVKKIRADGREEWLIEAQDGVNLKNVVDVLSDKKLIEAFGSAKAVNDAFTMYLAAKRAKRVGLEMLNRDLDTELTQAELDNVERKVEGNAVANAAFSHARNQYNAYNRGLLQFAADTGAISNDEMLRLQSHDDYIPFYRVQNGVVDMVIGDEMPVRVGNLRDSPHLAELKGDNKPIFDFLTSSVMNTAMLLDMSMHNIATKNAMWGLAETKVDGKRLATLHKVGKKKQVPQDAVTFKVHGEEWYAVVDTKQVGVDSALLVKGMSGITVAAPGLSKILGTFSRGLRRTVVASPLYAARQLVRDTTAAGLVSGANIMPLVSALQQIHKASPLEARGITGGQVLSGLPEDMSRMLAELQAGRGNMARAFSWFEAKSMQADSLTRRAQYASYIEQGMSELEATMAALESMNFSRRGVAPSVHFISNMIPFFNAQLQGLDVLYRAFRGQMPMNERLQIREKLLARGTVMFATSMLYAALMQDDEAYKNAPPEQKYGNWFVRLPGVEDPLRIPIPFELGYIFKALPEALVNMMANEEGAQEAWKALRHIALQTVPGGSSWFLPQMVKPALEQAFGKSTFTGRGLESRRELEVEPFLRYRDSTSGTSRLLGEMFNLSPVRIDALIGGYTGSMGLLAAKLVGYPAAALLDGPDGPTKRVSELPLIGPAFQPENANGIIDGVFDMLARATEVQKTYQELIVKGRVDEAEAYIEKHMGEEELVKVAGEFRKQIGEYAAYERQIRGDPDMTPDEKRKALDEIKAEKLEYAREIRELVAESRRQ